MAQKLDELLTANINNIDEVRNSPTAWVSPLVVVLKHNGEG